MFVGALGGARRLFVGALGARDDCLSEPWGALGKGKHA